MTTPSTTTPLVHIRRFETADTENVVALWETCGLTRPWNDPRRDILRKLEVQRDLFLVAEVGDVLAATVMAGYEGHRGWVNYLAVSPDHRGGGIARTLMTEVEQRLTAIGCPKLNLLVRADNTDALGFYEAIGYLPDQSVSLGRRLIPDD